MTASSISDRPASPTRRSPHPVWSALLLGLVVCGLLWFLNLPYRQVYQPNHDDVSALADGLLLRQGAHWLDWFTRGHSDFFDAYPEWPLHETAFARPAFQFLIYLAHFVFGRDWASYLALNYVAMGGVAAMAFAIARAALGLGNGASVCAAALVLLSTPVLVFSIGEVGAASECMAAALVGGAFFALRARRDSFGFALLLIALFTKETALWAPIAAALTALFRKGDDAPRHRALVALAMLGPLALWLGYRLAVFGGVGGTYATTQYAPLLSFLELSGRKLVHLPHLFMAQDDLVVGESHGLAERALWIAVYLVVFLLLIRWVLSGLRAAIEALGGAVRRRARLSVDDVALVTLWAALGLAFYFALALSNPRYATSAVMFVWPVVTAEVMRRRSMPLRMSLVVCLLLSLVGASRFLWASNPPSEGSDAGRFFRAAATLNTALQQVPPGIEDVFVVSAGGFVPVHPDYVRSLLGTRARLIRLVDISWECNAGEAIVAVNHRIVDGMITLDLTLPDCASRFFFAFSSTRAATLFNGRLPRGDSISYELPSGEAAANVEPASAVRRLVAHVRAPGPARFIIEHGAPSGGLAWFDTP